ncbi:hypothetical protein [Streptomyces collinus]|uniref:hypothetical protein n=1 Tax=Streptomyces collinus TaxID=42684 RepID=UPI0033E12B94
MRSVKTARAYHHRCQEPARQPVCLVSWGADDTDSVLDWQRRQELFTRSNLTQRTLETAGQVLADTASCLADSADDKPAFGDAAESAGTEAPATVPEDSPRQLTRTVSGRFTLGNGNGAPGLRVTVTALDAGTEQTADSMKPTVLATATTAADGSWTATLPEKLPAEVQAVADDNGGVLNLQAMTDGTTSSGVTVIGLDNLIAASPDAGNGQPTAFAANATDGGHTVTLVPSSPDGSSVGSEPTAAQEKQTFAAEVDQSPVASDAPDPMWQSDKSTLPADYSPFVVDGRDISAETVTPRVGGCNETKYKLSSKIAYTTVGEAHAFYDAKAGFTYSGSHQRHWQLEHRHQQGHGLVHRTQPGLRRQGTILGQAVQGADRVHQVQARLCLRRLPA